MFKSIINTVTQLLASYVINEKYPMQIFYVFFLLVHIMGYQCSIITDNKLLSIFKLNQILNSKTPRTNSKNVSLVIIFLLFLKINFIRVQLIYNVVLVSALCVLSHFGCVQLLLTPRTVAHQAPLSMDFSRQEYWSGLPFSPPGNLPDPGIKPTMPVDPALEADFLPLSHWGNYSKVNQLYIYIDPLFFRFLSHIGEYTVPSRVSCAMQQVLISYLLYVQQSVYVNPNFPISHYSFFLS